MGRSRQQRADQQVLQAGEPGAHYLLVSTRDPEVEEIRSFRIVDTVVTEEEVNIVDATVDA